MSRNFILYFCISTLLLLYVLPAEAQIGGTFGNQSGGGYGNQSGQNSNQSGQNGQYDANREPRTKEEEMALRRRKDSLKVADTIPLFNRVLIGADIFEPVATILGQSYWSSGIVIQADLKERIMPVLELGIGQSDITTNAKANYKSSKGFYGRIGVDIRMLGVPRVGTISFGARLGISSFSYDIYNIKISNPYWGEDFQGDILNQNGSASYLQLVAGARAKVGGCFYMGWSARYGFLINSSKTDFSKPFHIPGYGINNGASFLSFSYYLLFKLPFKESAKPIPKPKIIKRAP